MLDLIGKRLGQYQILEEIGRGGMAVVYKAYQPSLQRYVALKVLPAHDQDDAELLARFWREAEAAKALAHPNIVRVFEVGEAQETQFIAMEYVDRGSVAKELSRRRGPLDTGTATGIAAQIAAALDYAHRQGVIHRDVKPSNILLARDGRALLSDFGIAKIFGKRTLTQQGTLLGTPAYMSPEQARGRRELDGRSDIYSLGVVLYEMLTGDVPFRGDDPTVILRAILDDPPTPPSWLNPGIPPALERIMLRALAKEPEKRYATAGEMLAAFQTAATASPVVERPTVVSPSAARPAVRPRPSQMPALLAVAAPLITLTGLVMLMKPAPPAIVTPTRTRVGPTATIAVGATITPTTTTVAVTATPVYTSIATPTLIPAPVLGLPPNEASINDENVLFAWTSPVSSGDLYFDVRVWQEGQPHLGKTWVQGNTFSYRPTSNGKWYWAVAIIRHTGYDANGEKTWTPVSAESEVRWFVYSYPPPPWPTNTPKPEVF